MRLAPLPRVARKASFRADEKNTPTVAAPLHDDRVIRAVGVRLACGLVGLENGN